MRFQATETTPAVIPTASMADIAFLLIIFFMVTFTIEVDRTQVTLPKTVMRFEVPKKAAYVSITEGGQLKVSDGEQMSAPVQSADEVLSFALEVLGQDPTKEFVLKADDSVPYRYIDETIDALKQARAKVIYLLSAQETQEEGNGS